MLSVRLMATDEPRRDISANCRRQQGKPNSTHECTGCDCRCHHLAAPPDFRTLVETLKAEED